jgi:uncharacterized protein YaeQ
LTTHQFRLQISRVDDSVYKDCALPAAQHPSETLEHLYLRVLAYALTFVDGVALGPGLSDGDGADVWAYDLVGAVTLWVECGASDPQENTAGCQSEFGAHVVLLTCRKQRERDFVDEARKQKVKCLARIELIHIPQGILDRPCENPQRRSNWNITVSDGHLYIVAIGVLLDAPLRRRIAAEAVAERVDS